MTKMIFNVTEYGAIGDGQVKDTAAIQQAIDACSANGGGTVYFPPGTFYSGSLFLKSNVTLYLETGATILGSLDESDYTPMLPGKRFGSGQLIYGENLENVALIGRGVIDGNGPSFWTSEMINDVVLKPKDFRPRSLVLLKNCCNTLVRDLIIQNSPSYTLWLMGCDIATIHGVRILNPRKGPNTDAMDIDGCSNVHISDCHIDAGDDCIALKSDSDLLGLKKACENITVTNCTLASTTCAIRLGYEGDAPIRNCVFSNLVITDTDIGIDIVSILPEAMPRIKEGTQIENVMFNNIVMENVNRPIFLWLGQDGEGDFKGFMKNISISHVIARTVNGCYIGGMAERSLESISLDHVKLIVKGKMETAELLRPDVWGGTQTPWGILAQHVKGLKLQEIEIDWRQASGCWQGGLKCEEVEDLESCNFKEMMCC